MIVFVLSYLTLDRYIPASALIAQLEERKTEANLPLHKWMTVLLEATCSNQVGSIFFCCSVQNVCCFLDDVGSRLQSVRAH